MKKILDIGSGAFKQPGSVGMDIFPYEGVDIVHDMTKTPWPIEDHSFDGARGIHVIEHIPDFVAFMKEIHRICKADAVVEIRTPHFSSVNSWTDPTHVKHFSVQWYKVLTEGYLAAQTGTFECLESRVEFGKSLKAKIGSWIASFRGIEKWEKNNAFSYPGMDVVTLLKVKK